ncbi:MAG: glycoside hydrolase [Rhizobiales bacterium 63-7]|nr:lysozyme [Hyphomicrobiales bacterium]OJU70978.1 MAG: glycoside hydrolase [Rhizobiales bacterium 63-7]
MPINKIVPTARGKAALLAAGVAAVISGWAAFTTSFGETPATIRAAIAKGITPEAVQLAVDRLIKPWEGISTVAYLDRIAKPSIWTVCYGETKGIKPGMTFTAKQCEQMLITRVTNDYYLPLVDGVKGYTVAPVSVQAAMISGAYNYGVQAARGSTAARRIGERKYREACEAQTAFNKAGGKVINGLVKRREMGDAQRLGEAELCVSGL